MSEVNQLPITKRVAEKLKTKTETIVLEVQTDKATLLYDLPIYQKENTIRAEPFTFIAPSDMTIQNFSVFIDSLKIWKELPTSPIEVEKGDDVTITFSGSRVLSWS